MEKRTLINDLKTYTGGGFITRGKLAIYMGVKDPKNIDRYLNGLERVNGKYYFIADVAEKLKECSVID